MEWNNSTGGWNFGGMEYGTGMVSNNIDNGSGWSFLDELMNPNLHLLPESLLPVPSQQLLSSTSSPSIFPQPIVPLNPFVPSQQSLSSTSSPSIFPQPIVPLSPFASGTDADSEPRLQANIVPLNSFASGTDANSEPQPQANIVPLNSSTRGTDVEPQPQANDKGDLAPAGTDPNAKTSDMLNVESGARLGARNRRKPTDSREVVPLTAREDSDNIPDWLALASKYLYDGIEVCEWKECLDMWMGFEKEAGYLEMTAVSTTTKFAYISLTKGFLASFGS
jgi:hypothetical protein